MSASNVGEIEKKICKDSTSHFYLMTYNFSK